MTRCVSCKQVDTAIQVSFPDGESFAVCAGCLPPCQVLTDAGARVRALEIEVMPV